MHRPQDTVELLNQVFDELDRQEFTWGVQIHPSGTGTEEFKLKEAYYKKRCQDAADDDGRETWAEILLEEVFEALAADNELDLLTELIQVAAVCISFARAITEP